MTRHINMNRVQIIGRKNVRPVFRFNVVSALQLATFCGFAAFAAIATATVI